MIKKTVCYNSSPTLHIVEARVIECPSGPSLAEFLMVFLALEVLFIVACTWCTIMKKGSGSHFTRIVDASDAIGDHDPGDACRM